MTTENQPAGNQQETKPEAPKEGPWSMSYDDLSKFSGRVINTVTETVDKVSEAVTKTKLWELPYEELSKLVPSRTPKTVEQAAVAPSKASDGASKEPYTGAYFTPNKDTASHKKVRAVFNKLIKTESGGEHFNEAGGILTSNKGAEGLTQMMQKTQMNPGYGVEPLRDKSPEEFLRGGFDYLTAMEKKYKGDMRKALAAYNYGPGNVDKAIREARKAGVPWERKVPLETRNYLKKIVGG